jgi:hypothetical protein
MPEEDRKEELCPRRQMSHFQVQMLRMIMQIGILTQENDRLKAEILVYEEKKRDQLIAKEKRRIQKTEMRRLAMIEADEYTRDLREQLKHLRD